MKFLQKINFDRVKKIIILIIMDILSITGSFFMALWIRNDFSFDSIPKEQIETFSETIIYWAAAAVVVFAAFQNLFIVRSIGFVCFGVHLCYRYEYVGFLLRIWRNT